MRARLRLLLMLWLVGSALPLARPAAAQMDLSAALGRRVTRVDVVNHSRVRDAEVRTLFGVRPEDRYSVGAVQRGLQLLAQKPEIAEVVVRGEAEGVDGLALSLEVEAARLVYSVRFRGNRELDDDELHSRLRTSVDRPLQTEDLERDRTLLVERYAAEGFPAAAVTAHWTEGPGEHWVRVEFRVAEGEPQRIRRVEWPEDLPMEPERAAALLGLDPGDPASESRLREGTRRLVEILQKEEYPEAHTRRPRFEIRDGATVVVLGLHCGPATDLRIRGIDEWAARTLRPLLKARYGERITDEWLSETARVLHEQLFAEGYLYSQVTVEESSVQTRRKITFRIDRGRRVTLETVRFEGNAHVPTSELKDYMSLVVGGVLTRPPFSTAAVNRDLKALADYYTSLGFLDVRVAVLEQQTLPTGNMEMLLHVDEGKRYRFATVQCSDERAAACPPLPETAGPQAGAPADPMALEAGRRELLRRLAAQGRGSAQVVVSAERDPAQGEVNVRYRVLGGPPETFGQVVVCGNARTQTKIIVRELTFREGQPWNPEAVAESRRRLFRLGSFRSVRIEPLPAAVGGGARPVRIWVEEQDAGNFSFGFGYGREEGLKGSVSLAHTNLQGYGRALEFRATADNLDESYAVNFREPWLFNNPVDLRLSLLKTYEDREAYNLSSLGFQSALEKEFSERLRGSLLYTLSRNRLSAVRDPVVVADANLNDYVLSAIGPVLAWDSRDDPFNPRRGFYQTGTAEWALDVLGSQVRYDRYTFGSAAYLSAGAHTLAFYAGGGIALKLARNVELPVNKRFFLGGRNTVRGYERDELGPTDADGNAVGGDTMFNVKAEWRYPLWDRLGGVCFWDAGNVWSRVRENPDFSRLRQGAGAGLRYRTPVGPLSFDVGWKLDRRSGESPYVWHFTVGNVF